MPAVDQRICGSWNQLENDFYNKLPFWLAEAEAAGRKYWSTWSRLFGKVPWKPNMGDTMRRVMAEPTPVLRQLAFPQLLAQIPYTDVVSYRERKMDAQVRLQNFVSPAFSFLPEFQDFLKHVDKTMMNLNRQISVFEDMYYRTMAWSMAPYVYVCGVGLVDAPTALVNTTGDAAGSKTYAWLQSLLQAREQAQTSGYLTFQELYKALNEFEQTVGGTPYEGSGLPGGDSEPLNEHFCLIQDAESWNAFVNDPWVKENRQLSMNIVTEAFRGDIFGRIRSKLERYPMRYAVDENLLPSIKDPETVEVSPLRDDFGRTKPNPLYSRIANSPIGIAFLVGGDAGEIISVGPPPSVFTASGNYGVKMDWNGKAYLNKNFSVPCKAPDGTIYYEPNPFGNFIRGQAQLALGMSLTNPQNVLPIIYSRRSGVTNNLQP